MLIEQIVGNCAGKSCGDVQMDRVVMSREDMKKTHQKVVSEKGVELAISLEPDAEIKPKDILFHSAEGCIVVELEQEDALVIFPKGCMQWGKVAYNIGNMHKAAYLTEEAILVPYDHILESILQKIGVEFRREERQLVGEGAAVKSGRHSHGHAHTHTHEAE